MGKREDQKISMPCIMIWKAVINYSYLVIKDFEERKIIMAEGNNHKYIHDPTIDSIDLKSDLLG